MLGLVWLGVAADGKLRMPKLKEALMLEVSSMLKQDTRGEKGCLYLH